MIKKLLCGLSLVGLLVNPSIEAKPRLNISLGETNVKLIKALEITNGIVPTVPRIMKCLGTPEIGQVAWVNHSIDGSRSMYICSEWIDIFTIEELALILLHEAHHYKFGMGYTYNGQLITFTRAQAEEAADQYAYVWGYILGISRKACESELKIAQVFKANPFIKYSEDYPSQATRFARCYRALSN